MSKIKLTADLDRLIKRAAEVKTAAVKQAEGVSAKLDNAEDGTSAATTGAQAAANKTDAAATTAAMVDGGAKDNKANASVTKNTDGSAAAATDGQKGPAAGEFAVKKDADNGKEEAQNKVVAVRKLANDLRAAADAMLTKLDRFIVKQARASTNPQVKTAAEAMADDDLAAQASDALMEQIAAGQVSDEDAAQILDEALQAGAITPEELQEAAALTEQANQAGGAPQGAPEAGAEEQLKVAAAQIGPDHPRYMDKLAAVNDEDMQAGYAFFNKLAEVLTEEAAKEEAKETPAEEKAEGAEHEKAETPAEEKAEEKVEGKAEEKPAEKPADAAQVVDAMSGVNLAPADDAEKQALEAVKQELGINDQQLTELAATPVPVTQDKVAAAKAMYRAAIMAKVAALKK